MFKGRGREAYGIMRMLPYPVQVAESGWEVRDLDMMTLKKNTRQPAGRDDEDQEALDAMREVEKVMDGDDQEALDALREAETDFEARQAESLGGYPSDYDPSECGSGPSQ